MTLLNIPPAHSMALKQRKVSDGSRIVFVFLWICIFFISAPIGILKSKTCLKLKLFIHVFWCVFVILATLVATYVEYIVFNDSLPDVQKFLYLSEYMINLVIVSMTPLICYSKRRIFDSFWSQINVIDKELANVVKSDPSYKPITRFLYIYTFLLSIFVGLSLPTVYFYQGKNIVGFLRSTMVYVVPNMANASQLGQYYGILIYLRLRMKCVQNFIQKMNFETKNAFENLTSLRITFSKLEYLHFKVNHKTSSITGMTFLSAFLVISIQIFVFYQDIAENKIRNLDLTLFSLIWLCLHFGKVICIYWFNSEISKVRNDLNVVLNQHNHNYPDEYAVCFHIKFCKKL